MIEPEPEAITAELKKADFPEVEGDVAPSAVVPKACKALTKQSTKIDGLISVFLATPQLSTLQEKNLVCLIFDGFTCPTIFLGFWRIGCRKSCPDSTCLGTVSLSWY